MTVRGRGEERDTSSRVRRHLRRIVVTGLLAGGTWLLGAAVASADETPDLDVPVTISGIVDSALADHLHSVAALIPEPAEAETTVFEDVPAEPAVEPEASEPVAEPELVAVPVAEPVAVQADAPAPVVTPAVEQPAAVIRAAAVTTWPPRVEPAPRAAVHPVEVARDRVPPALPDRIPAPAVTSAAAGAGQAGADSGARGQVAAVGAYTAEPLQVVSIRERARNAATPHAEPGLPASAPD
jgi:hypothetical protein